MSELALWLKFILEALKALLKSTNPNAQGSLMLRHAMTHLADRFRGCAVCKPSRPCW